MGFRESSSTCTKIVNEVEREGDLMMPIEHWHIKWCEVASHSIKRNYMI